MDDETPRPLTSTEVCARLGLTWRQLHDLEAATGDLQLAPAGRTPGGKARYAPDDVARWAARWATGAAS
ncbi:MAG: hypothetical protein OEV62_00060 [Actinomycetota bacterium]|nr:hypothetical protein [Actinomycetota bacterium]